LASGIVFGIAPTLLQGRFPDVRTAIVVLATFSCTWPHSSQYATQLHPPTVACWLATGSTFLLANLGIGPASDGLIALGASLLLGAIVFSNFLPASRIVRQPTVLIVLMLSCGTACMLGHLPSAVLSLITCSLHAWLRERLERPERIRELGEDKYKEYQQSVSLLLPIRSALLFLCSRSGLVFWVFAFGVEALCSLSKGPLAPREKALAPQAELVEVIRQQKSSTSKAPSSTQQ